MFTERMFLGNEEPSGRAAEKNVELYVDSSCRKGADVSCQLRVKLPFSK